MFVYCSDEITSAAYLSSCNVYEISVHYIASVH